MNIQTLEKINNTAVLSETQIEEIFPENEFHLNAPSAQHYGESHFRKIVGDKYDELMPKLHYLAGLYRDLPKMFTDFRAATKAEEQELGIASADDWMGLSEMTFNGNMVNLYDYTEEVSVNGKTFTSLHHYGNYLIQEEFFKQLETNLGADKVKELFHFNPYGRDSQDIDLYKEAECKPGFDFFDIYQTESELDASIAEAKPKGKDISILKTPEHWEKLLNRCVEDFIFLNEKLPFETMKQIRSEVLTNTVKELQNYCANN